ncbi:TerB family tellurite resistance protein [Paroceanicella profunda]|uniref:TerB family tellurite resistance protein n=1 Tax=Paroceanicella profunda TaxID=2579971 RepID=A0A5B8G280_9RHOB|nr:TerB family tellurite resistance protein [Paroceanicella profunda]QDL93409.1 TerB family tellurite resistance protein [Paroceanicella profunda]
MFSNFFESLMAASGGERRLHADDERLALAALLVRVARADGVYEASERAEIDRVLAARFALSTPDTEALRRSAEAVENDAPDTVRFTRTLKDAVPYEQRLGLVEALWQVALADDRRSNAENNLLRLVVNLLGVSDRDSGIARQTVQDRLGAGGPATQGGPWGA